MNKGQISIGILVTIIFGAIAGLAGWNLAGFSKNSDDHIKITNNLSTLNEQIKTIGELKEGMRILNQNFINSQIGRPLISLVFSTTTAEK